MMMMTNVEDKSEMDLDDHDQADEDVEESVNDDEDDQLDWDLLFESEQTEYIKLAVKLGHLINKSLYKDSLNVLKCYKVYDKDQFQWLSDRNPVLIYFIEGYTGLKLSSHTDPTKIVNASVHAVEQLLYAQNLNAICPFAFKCNVAQCLESTSKFCVQLTGAWEPAGGFTSVTNFVLQPHPPASCPPNDFHTTFGNNQKLACSSGRIKEGASVPFGICTSVSYIEPGFESSIMRNNSLKPGTWLKQPSVSLLQSVNNQEKHEIKCFSKYQGDS